MIRITDFLFSNNTVPPLCTPSRSAFMTGKYPFKIGMQHNVILSDEPWCLGLDEVIMPQYFREAGYRTHLIGKWHLGFHKKICTPLFRGFDSHFGYLGPHIDYYDQSILWVDYPLAKTYARALDFRSNLVVNDTLKGRYVTELLTEAAIKIVDEYDGTGSLFLLLNHLAPHSGNEDNPLQAPDEVVERFRHIKDPQRRTYAGEFKYYFHAFIYLIRFLFYLSHGNHFG